LKNETPRCRRQGETSVIIDIHGHVSAPPQLWAYKAGLLASRGSHGRGGVKVTEAEMNEALNATEIGPRGHLEALKRHGTDVQLISPRPFQLMHSEKPARLVRWFAEECHNVIHKQTQMYPGKFFGVASLPHAAGTDIKDALPELERCVKELGFVGTLFNPDPFENGPEEAPPLGDRYWYPLYEKLCELDIPAHIHTASSRSEKASYSVHLINEGTLATLGLLNSDVFKDFPTLKIIVSHGGGAIPYQLGRFDAPSLRGKGSVRVRDRLKLLYFDTVLYTADALELLIKTVGADRCIFGTECPGVGSTIDPETGETMDNIKPHIDKIAWLSAADKEKIFSGNAKKVFKLKV
jgi:predicted TIM-barrel fold metal-dependent hydrolase